MKIVHVLAPARFGGLERVVGTLAGGHARRGHEVHVLAVTDVREAADHPALASLRGTGAVVLGVPASGRAYRRERRFVADYCRSVKAEVLHTHGYRADVVDGPVGRRLSVRTVSTVHGYTGGDWRNRIYEALDRRSLRQFDAVVAVSRTLRAKLLLAGVSAEVLHVVPNAAPDDREPAERQEARLALGLDAVQGPVIGWVGRFTYEKAPDVFLSAVAMSHLHEVHAAVIGAGPMDDALRRLAGRLGIASRVTWHGAVPDAGRLLRAFDVLVLSSRTEGTPILLFEAARAGVPLVVTSVGGVPDVFGPREALLVPPDNAQALGDAVGAVFEDRPAARERARAARERVKTAYALEPWLDRYETIYGGRATTGGSGPLRAGDDVLFPRPGRS